MLESIIMKKVATYDDAGIEIGDLKKINFIYGTNGCGKTTITKAIENPNDPLFADCALAWKNGTAVKTLVYNKDFRNRNFGKGSINGVFTLGQATKEQLESIQTMQAELEEIKENGINKKETLEKQLEEKRKCENEFKEHVWIDIYKKNESHFKEAFKGVQQKETFKTRLLAEFGTNQAALQSYAELEEKAKTVFGGVPKEMSLIATFVPARIVEIESHYIWQRKIVGKSDVEIGKLVEKLHINDWVNEGRSYLSADNTTCPFCQQQTITRSFREQLEDYFDESFKDDTQVVKDLYEEYNRLAASLVNIISEVEVSEKMNQNTKLDLEAFVASFKTLSTQFVSNKQLLMNKLKEPSRSVVLSSTKEMLEDIQKLITIANLKIRKHNSIVANFSMERSNLIDSIWKHLVEESRMRIEAFQKRVNGLQKGIDELTKACEQLRKEWSALDRRIKHENRNVTSVQPSVDELNKTLKSYGFSNFEIVASKTLKNQYHIQREDGTIAESTLSEGEITFITFLYFLQLCKGSTNEETITEDRILVVDDPISSLDSNVLFLVSSLLKEIIKLVKKGEGNIKQLILLTHNVYFHKEVSFVDGRRKQNGDTFYWILRKSNGASVIENFGMKNPIHSSYELLWREVRVKQSGITIQNTMRRIIENYFKVLGKYADDDLIKEFENAQDQEICRSLICWINDGSHGISDDLFVEHQETLSEKYFEIFKGIFKQMGHLEHFNMMMETAND